MHDGLSDENLKKITALAAGERRRVAGSLAEARERLAQADRTLAPIAAELEKVYAAMGGAAEHDKKRKRLEKKQAECLAALEQLLGEDGEGDVSKMTAAAQKAVEQKQMELFNLGKEIDELDNLLGEGEGGRPKSRSNEQAPLRELHERYAAQRDAAQADIDRLEGESVYWAAPERCATEASEDAWDQLSRKLLGQCAWIPQDFNDEAHELAVDPAIYSELLEDETLGPALDAVGAAARAQHTARRERPGDPRGRARGRAASSRSPAARAARARGGARARARARAGRPAPLAHAWVGVTSAAEGRPSELQACCGASSTRRASSLRRARSTRSSPRSRRRPSGSRGRRRAAAARPRRRRGGGGRRRRLAPRARAAAPRAAERAARRRPRARAARRRRPRQPLLGDVIAVADPRAACRRRWSPGRRRVRAAGRGWWDDGREYDVQFGKDMLDRVRPRLARALLRKAGAGNAEYRDADWAGVAAPSERRRGVRARRARRARLLGARGERVVEWAKVKAYLAHALRLPRRPRPATTASTRTAASVCRRRSRRGASRARPRGCAGTRASTSACTRSRASRRRTTTSRSTAS